MLKAIVSLSILSIVTTNSGQAADAVKSNQTHTKPANPTSHTIQTSPASPASPASQIKQTNSTTMLNGNIEKKHSTERFKYQINNYAPTSKMHSPNGFQDINQSMPAAAVQENLARKHELPSAQTAVLKPGAVIGTPGPSSSAANSAAAAGASPDVLSAGKVAIPESKGATNNTFYK